MLIPYLAVCMIPARTLHLVWSLFAPDLYYRLSETIQDTIQDQTATGLHPQLCLVVLPTMIPVQKKTVALGKLLRHKAVAA